MASSSIEPAYHDECRLVDAFAGGSEVAEVARERKDGLTYDAPVPLAMRPPATAIMALLALASATSVAEAPSPLPGPAVAGQRPRALANGAPAGAASCGGCHAEIAAEWRTSAHGSAWGDPLFQKSYAVERLAWCRTCHAPEGDPAREPTPAAQDESVGCATCHVARGLIVSSSASVAHGGLADARWATGAACAACHQFLFPDVSAQVIPTAMQNTVREWASSSFAATSCNDCHMPRILGRDGREHRSHRFLVRDREMLASALRFAAERREGAVTITLQSGRVGHAVPTGDLFRQLVVRAFVVPDAHHERPLGSPVILSRRFLDVPRRPESPHDPSQQRVEVADTRLAPPGRPGSSRSVEIPVPKENGGAVVRWEVVYQRMSDPVAVSFGISQSADEIVIAHGALRPRDSVTTP